MAAGWAGLCGPAVMGILNVTPDSFSDGGRHFDAGAAIAAGQRMVADGAAIVDIGGESTRPGAPALPVAEEMARVLPVLRGLAGGNALLSIDTRNAATMAAALDAGATIVNDVSALTHDRGAAPLVAARGCPVVLMHMRGTPDDMDALARYDDVAAEVVQELGARVAAAQQAGIARSAIAIDPGFGFAKNAAQNLRLLHDLRHLAVLGLPILLGVSRKRFVGAAGAGTGAAAPAAQRLAGSLAAALAGLARGAIVLRVHDVAETMQALRVWQAIEAAGAPPT